MSKHATIFVAAMLAMVAQAAFAGPVEDYKTGLESFKAGDVVSAMPPLQSASDAGHPDAQALLGYILHLAGENEAALVQYRKSAEQGNPEGQYGMFVLYSSGDGVAKDLPAAISWLQKAAEQGSTKAINALAQHLISGNAKGFQDADTLAWIKRAADKEYVPAVEALAKAYREGRYGLTPDIAQASVLEAKARKLRGLPDKPEK